MEVYKIEEDNADVGSVTYFVDHEGNYYYQPAMEILSQQSQISVSLDNAQNTEDTEQNDAQMPVEEEMFQTGILIPTETDTGEIRYILVVQEDNQPHVNDNIDIKIDQQDKWNEEYALNDRKEHMGFVTENDISPHRKSKRDNSHKIVKKSGEDQIYKLTCKLCAYTTPRKNLLLRHMKSHSAEKPYKCSICHRCFKYLCSLQNHLNMHNIKSKICKYCQSTFTTSGELMKHVCYNQTFKKPYGEECDYASVELSKLQRHVRYDTGERPYQYPQCTYASADTFRLQRPLRTHTDEMLYQFDDCNMCFSQSTTLESHNLQSEKKMFSCELCPATYGRKTDLRIHVKNQHTFDQPMKCKHCGNIFPDRYSWNIHNKTHEDEKCFKCNICPYASTTFADLRLHMVKHIGEKSYSCDVCDQTFSQKQWLRRHQNLIHDPGYMPKLPKEKMHTCYECKRTYAHKGNLIRHLAVHDPDYRQKERPSNFNLNRHKFVEPDQIEDKANLDSNKEDSKDVEEELQLDEDCDQLKLEEFMAEGESIDQLQYIVLVVDDLHLMDDEEQETAPEYGKEEGQEE